MTNKPDMKYYMSIFGYDGNKIVVDSIQGANNTNFPGGNIQDLKNSGFSSPEEAFALCKNTVSKPYTRDSTLYHDNNNTNTNKPINTNKTNNLLPFGIDDKTLKQTINDMQNKSKEYVQNAITFIKEIKFDESIMTEIILWINTYNDNIKTLDFTKITIPESANINILEIVKQINSYKNIYLNKYQNIDFANNFNTIHKELIKDYDNTNLLLTNITDINKNNIIKKVNENYNTLYNIFIIFNSYIKPLVFQISSISSSTSDDTLQTIIDIYNKIDNQIKVMNLEKKYQPLYYKAKLSLDKIKNSINTGGKRALSRKRISLKKSKTVRRRKPHGTKK